MDKTIIRLDNIAKSFGNVRVIHHISFSIEAGKVYALAGENGAGNEQLFAILYLEVLNLMKALFLTVIKNIAVLPFSGKRNWN